MCYSFCSVVVIVVLFFISIIGGHLGSDVTLCQCLMFDYARRQTWKKIWTLLGAGTESRDPSTSVRSPISGILNSNLKTNFRPSPSHKFLNWSLPPKNTVHSHPPLDAFEKKILFIKTSTEGFHPVNKEKHSNDSYLHLFFSLCRRNSSDSHFSKRILACK